MNKTVLLAWIGNTDLRASRNELPNGVGPLASAVGARQFSIIHLLTNQNKKESTDFVKWLKHYTEAPVTLWHKKLSGPTHFGGIYEAVCEVIDSILEEKKSPRFTFHLSPGTPAMAAVWIILAKTSCPAELIESSLEDGVKTVSIPFELAADYTPARTIENSAELMRLSQGLPPEAPEFHAIVHRCLAMKQVIAQARRIAPEDVPLLIQG
ncbi:MAG: hypothetical protein KDA65_03575, partial [Planctomycetaceae bacterium]|nr:hypothetical protein [Planctomycetaceae bacterium]